MFSTRPIGHLSPLLAFFLGTVHALAAGYTLTINTVGSGTVNRNPTNTVYPAGATVTLTALPNSGWLFSGWSGDATGSTNPLNVAMTSDKSITAHFDPLPTYTLGTSVNGAGLITLSPTGGLYLSNTIVSATATPAAGWVFTSWSGDAFGSVNPLSITVDRNKSIAAFFAQIAAIDVGLQNVGVGLNDSVLFNIHAVGTAPLTYQWYFNGEPIPGATGPAYSLAAVALSDEGDYAVTVTNLYGTASSFATLTITNACSGTNVVHSPSEAELKAAVALGGLVRCCFNGTVSLTSTIDVTNDVTLDARGRNVVISGNSAVRLFSVRPGVTFSATNVVFAYGRHVGADGASADSSPAQPGKSAEGGAISSEGGFLRLISCVFATNSVNGGQGGNGNFSFENGAVGGEAHGGAVSINGGTLLVDSVTLLGNSAQGGPGGFSSPLGVPATAGNALGGAIFITNASAVLVNSVVVSNSCLALAGGDGASGIGGGVLLASGSVTFSNTVLHGNTAAGEANPYILGSMVSPGSGFGGGLGAIAGQIQIVDSTVRSNLAQGGDALRYSATGAGQGGGVFSRGTVFASNTTFWGNCARSGNGSNGDADGRGGGVFNGGVWTFRSCALIANSAIGGNSADFGAPATGYPGGHGMGGGLYNKGETVLTNCTIALNSAIGGNGGGIYSVPGRGLGGGIYDSNGVVTAMNITIAANAVIAGTARLSNSIPLGANLLNTNGVLSLRNSLLAYPGTNANAWGSITDAGFNMSSDGSADFQSGSSFNFTDPLLLPLANNGGPTPTMALSANSPAVDFGTALGAPDVDQRALPRPQGAGVDIGAYELFSGGFPPPMLTLTRQGANLLLSFTAQPDIFYSLQVSTSLPGSWTELEMIGPFQGVTLVTRTITIQSQSLFFRLALH